MVEIVWQGDGQPICFGKSGVGNVCSEPDSNFVSIPDEPLFWYTCYWLNRLKDMLTKEVSYGSDKRGY